MSGTASVSELLLGTTLEAPGRAGAHGQADEETGGGARRPTIRLHRPVPVLAAVTLAGPMEEAGPLHGRFDRSLRDHLFGLRTWEMAEAKFQETAADMAIAAAGLRREDIDVVLSGDLQNQLGAASFAGRAIDLPMLGLYGACATCGEGLLLAAALCDAGYCRHAVVVVSSHHDAAERQFRFPTEFGTQRSPTAQWTATGAAAFVLGRPDEAVAGGRRSRGNGGGDDRRDGGADGARRHGGGADPARRPHDGSPDDRGHDRPDGAGAGGASRRDSAGDRPPSHDGTPAEAGPTGGAPSDGASNGAPGHPAAARRPCIVAGTPGRVVDMGIKDPYDMGGAEAPAAADTIAHHLRGRGAGPDAYDAIVTGDLARFGRPVCEDLLRERGIEASLLDCGERLYDPKRQDVHAGGSGAACCGLVLAADLLPRVRAGQWRRLLFVATGALLSTTSYQQGESIPCIAHAVEIVAPGDAEADAE